MLPDYPDSYPSNNDYSDASSSSSFHQSDPSLDDAPTLNDMLKTMRAATSSDTAASKEATKSSAQDTADTAEGSQLTIQTLYEGPAKCQCCINWVEEYPDDLRMEIEQQEQSKQKALVVRMRKNHKEGKSLVLDSVLVQSKSLKATLARVFEGYEGITPNLKKLVFRAPFHPFYYRWNNFTQILDDEKKNDPEAASYSLLLYNVLDAELRDIRGEVADLLDNDVITYELLWSLFEPGDRVIAKVGSHLQFFSTQQSGYNEKGIFEVEGKYIDWNGFNFGYARGTLQVCPFSGTRHVTELEVYPARFCPSLKDTETEVIARGKRFTDLRGFHHMAYSGAVTYKDSWGRDVTSNVRYKLKHHPPPFLFTVHLIFLVINISNQYSTNETSRV